jgi:hypothetical protein
VRGSKTWPPVDPQITVNIEDIKPQHPITSAELDAIERLLGEALAELVGQKLA